MGFGAQGFEPLDLAILPQLRTGGAIVVQGPEFSRKPEILALRATESSKAINQDQFLLFKLGDQTKPILDLADIDPGIEGKEDEPDIVTNIALVAFHFDEGEAIAEDTKATLRLDLGKDPQSDSLLDTLYWSIASGLDLWRHLKESNKTEPKKLSTDLATTFRRRPVEIPGGLGQLRVELVAHPPLPWWRKLISFSASDETKTLISTIGFPGITVEAVRLVDELLSRFDESAAKPIFSSRPMTLAFSKRARDEFRLGAAGVSVACIDSGFYVMVRAKDVGALIAEPPLFLTGTGLLVPEKAWQAQKPNFNWAKNPYNGLTYAILRVKSRMTKIGAV